MSWTAPPFTPGVAWQDAPSTSTALSAADLNLEESAEAAYAAQVGQSVASWAAANFPLASYVAANYALANATLRGSSPYPDLSQVGGVYDDATDCTSAAQAALQNYGGFRLSGAIRISQLTMPAGGKILGEVPGGYGILLANRLNPANPPLLPPHGRMTRLAGTNAHMIVGAQGAAHCQLVGVHLDGNANNNTSGDTIHLDDVGVAEEAQWILENCFLDASTSGGVALYVGTGRRAVKVVKKSVIYNGSGVGIRWNGSDGGIHQSIIGGHHGDNIQVGASVLHITGNDIYGSVTGNGINVLSTISQVMISGNGIDRNALNGVYLAPSSTAVTITGNALHSNSQATNGAAHHINVQTTTGSVSVDANVFGVDSGMTNAAGYCVYLNGAGVTAKAHGNTMQSAAAANLGLTNDFTRLYL